MTRTALVVVNHAAAAGLPGRLVPLRAGAHVVVVDSLSSAGERDLVRALADEHGWDLVALPSNPGFGGGVNAGLARAWRAGADVAVLLNPDASLDGDGLDRLAASCRADPDVLVAPRVVRPDGRTWFDGGRLDLATGRTWTLGWRRAPEGALPWLSGACLAGSRALWERLGGFDEDYFLYWEDVDLSYRCRRAGLGLRVEEGVTAVHAVGEAQGVAKSDLYRYYNCRNRLLFARKHLPPRVRRAWWRAAPSHALAVSSRDGRRRLLARPWSLWPALRGTLAALRLP